MMHGQKNIKKDNIIYWLECKIQNSLIFFITNAYPTLLCLEFYVTLCYILCYCVEMCCQYKA